MVVVDSKIFLPLLLMTLLAKYIHVLMSATPFKKYILSAGESQILVPLKLSSSSHTPLSDEDTPRNALSGDFITKLTL